MNVVRAIAFNLRVQNSETDPYGHPKREGCRCSIPTSSALRPTPVHGVVPHRVNQHGWKKSNERQSKDRLFQLPEAFFRASQSAQERLPGSMSELHETDYLRYQLGRSQYKAPIEGRPGFSHCGGNCPGHGQNGRSGAEARPGILTTRTGIHPDQFLRHASLENALDRDDFSSNRRPDLSSCLSMIFSENRYPLFRIML